MLLGFRVWRARQELQARNRLQRAMVGYERPKSDHPQRQNFLRQLHLSKQIAAISRIFNEMLRLTGQQMRHRFNRQRSTRP
jgi:hypothetical protein